MSAKNDTDKITCDYCGKICSSKSGYALHIKASHPEHYNDYKKGNEKNDSTAGYFRPQSAPTTYPARQPVIAIAKGDDILVNCRTCGKKHSIYVTKDVIKDNKISKDQKVLNRFCDDRFVGIYCCDKYTLLPVRHVTDIAAKPGKEMKF